MYLCRYICIHICIHTYHINMYQSIYCRGGGGGWGLNGLHVCDMTHPYVKREGFQNICDMTHSYVTWLIHMRHVEELALLLMGHDSFIRVTWLIHMCDMVVNIWEARPMTHAYGTGLVYLGHDTFIWDMTHSYVPRGDARSVTRLCVWHGRWYMRSSSYGSWHDSFICVTWLIHMCDRWYMRSSSYGSWHDSFICVTWLIHMCDMTHSYV